MNLIISEWIRVGCGNLYAAPFLARCFLYRLHDRHSTILAYHEPNHVPLMGKGLGITEVYSIGQVPRAICIHFNDTSDSIQFSELLAKAPVLLDLSGDHATEYRINDFVVRAEPYELTFSGRRIVAYDEMQDLHFNIADSDFEVAGPADVSDWPQHFDLCSLRMRCWKLSVIDQINHLIYDVRFAAKWSLRAFDLGTDGQPNVEMLLHRKELAGPEVKQ